MPSAFSVPSVNYHSQYDADHPKTDHPDEYLSSPAPGPRQSTGP